ncbi:2689_t:CDS:2 [Paraglomus brasilianum]|uniref:2689_t:CDS:1 n=1 Tax=Paraglomus brasilianum TaxID=144538 RepID=A0A9N9ANU9_9GLOM|nr:2689_t:CDS:2 [Paraglomus brasilianum]
MPSDYETACPKEKISRDLGSFLRLNYLSARIIPRIFFSFECDNPMLENTKHNPTTTCSTSDRAVAHHLRGVYPDISEKTVRILEENEINGRTFLELTEEKLMQDGMIRGPAANISKNSK